MSDHRVYAPAEAMYPDIHRAAETFRATNDPSYVRCTCPECAVPISDTDDPDPENLWSVRDSNA